MRNLLALDASEFALPEAAGANFRGHGRRLATQARGLVRTRFGRRRSGAAASEMATMVVVLAAWAVIAGYLFGHAAEGLIAGSTGAGTAGVAAPAPAMRPAAPAALA